ncbi:O-methyltransferase [Lysobacter sp. TAB13]|uniref:O-methyltransferase n=1 Tax=Lysobacter sp. TAB13 TaxID=3233065 RepID=UPI003F9823EE
MKAGFASRKNANRDAEMTERRSVRKVVCHRNIREKQAICLGSNRAKSNANTKYDALFVLCVDTRFHPIKADIAMNTLAVSPLAPLLDRLFKQADAATSPAVAEMSRDERLRLMQSKTEYLDFYERMKDLWLPVSRETGHLLYMLARACNARSVVEFGTSFGISTLHLAAAVRDNGGGRIITTEFEPVKVARARQHFAEGGLLDLVEVRAGDALQTLALDLPDSIDLLLLDGAKSLYPEVLALVETRLRPGALIVADNADYSPDYLAHVRSPASGYMSIPFADDVELSMRLP